MSLMDGIERAPKKADPDAVFMARRPAINREAWFDLAHSKSALQPPGPLARRNDYYPHATHALWSISSASGVRSQVRRA